MFVRTIQAQTESPEAEDMDLGAALCPPHDFQPTWAIPPGEDLHAETVPAMLCSQCGDVGLLRIPADAA